MVVLNNILRVTLKRGVYMNRGEEDYLKAIYELAQGYAGDTAVSNKALMNYFNHSAQTVNEMIKKLVKLGMVAYLPYKGSILTDLGIKASKRMVRVHRLWETFLVDCLGYDWEAVHEEAEHLEHATSDILEEKLFRFLNEPKVCPHGNVIPNDHDSHPIETLKLNQAEVGMTYTFVRVKDEKSLLSYLSSQGIKLGSTFRITHLDEMGELMTIELLDKSLVMSFKIASQIDIKKEDAAC